MSRWFFNDNLAADTWTLSCQATATTAVIFYSALFWGSQNHAESLWERCHILHNRGWCRVIRYMCPASKNITIKSWAKLFSKISSSMWQALWSVKQSFSTPRQPICISGKPLVAEHAGQKTQLSNFPFFSFFSFFSGPIFHEVGTNLLRKTIQCLNHHTITAREKSLEVVLRLHIKSIEWITALVDFASAQKAWTIGFSIK